MELSGSCISIVSHPYSPKRLAYCDRLRQRSCKSRRGNTEFDMETQTVRTGQATSNHCFLHMQTQRQQESHSFTRQESSLHDKTSKQKHDPDSTISKEGRNKKRGRKKYDIKNAVSFALNRPHSFLLKITCLSQCGNLMRHQCSHANLNA